MMSLALAILRQDAHSSFFLFFCWGLLELSRYYTRLERTLSELYIKLLVAAFVPGWTMCSYESKGEQGGSGNGKERRIIGQRLAILRYPQV